MIQEYNFSLFADYFQFYIQDEGVSEETPDIWNEEQLSQLLAVYPGIIAVGTVRNMTVPVKIEILDKRPIVNFNKWDKINECSIEIKSGKVVVMGCTDNYNDAARITVQAGVYIARIHYGKLNMLSEDGLEGDDHYEITLWPATKETIIERPITLA